MYADMSQNTFSAKTINVALLCGFGFLFGVVWLVVLGVFFKRNIKCGKILVPVLCACFHWGCQGRTKA